MTTTSLLLDAERARAAHLDEEISALEQILSELRSERAAIQDRLDAYKFPVLTLPNEIVVEIFVRTLPPYPRAAPLGSTQKLLAICSQWRAIALATPELWRSIRFQKQQASFGASLKNALRKWLGRASSLPLAFAWDFDPSIIDTRDLISAISSYRSRWDILNITILKRYLQLLSGPAPALRELYLCASDGDVAPALSGPSAHLLRLHDAPLLRSVVLSQVPIDPETMPWQHLADLTISGLRMVNCAVALRAATRLLHCRLEIVSGLPRDYNQTIESPSLQTLVLTHASRKVENSSGMRCLSFPALRRFQCSLDIFTGIDALSENHLAGFLDRSGCHLEVLLLSGVAPWIVPIYRQTLSTQRVGTIARREVPPRKMACFLWSKDEWWEVNVEGDE
ncbi:F-box domain-containing protein [Mycena kentingensis (nom. inval.)]|nr:F-box domain-containing protein [Mycena kentingensis (nom. inval.)]